MPGEFESLSSSALYQRLKKEIPSLSSNVLDAIREHKIDGDVFTSLNDDYLREIAPLLGDRLKLKKIISEIAEKLSTPPNLPPTRDKKYSATPSTLKAQTASARRSLINNSTDSSDDSTAATVMSSSIDFCSDDDICGTKEQQTLNQDSSQKCIEEDMVTDCGKKFSNSPGELSIDWAKTLILPSRFSTATSMAIETGVLTSSARVEIVHSISTLILMHTSHPTPSDIEAILKRLIEKHPNLQDTTDKGFNSWKKKLLTKFKNLRRPKRALQAGITVSPPSKKPKTFSPASVTQSKLDDSDYNKHVGFLQHSFASNKWSLAGMLTLLEETAELCRAWIRDENPSVSQVLEKFPCLTDSRIMLNEFCALTGTEESIFKKNWEKWENLVFKYAPLESKKSVKSLLSQYHAHQCDNANRTPAYALELLSALLSTNRLSGQSLLTIFQGESIDIDECIAGLNTTAPCIAAFGVTQDDIADVKVIVETDNILSVPDLSTAIHFCFACYYVFNISFTSPFKHILLFLEKYVYGLKSTQKLPMAVVLLHDGMERVIDK